MQTKHFNSGFLDRDGHKIWYAEYGNPLGVPVLLLHGGPGGQSDVKTVEELDQNRYRLIQIDQRGCGNSTPAAN